MSKSKWSQIKKEELINIINSSSRFSEVLKKIGYSQVQDKRIISAIKSYCNSNNINYSHLKEGEDEYSGTTRICNICGKEKKIEEFYFIKNNPLYTCKECQKEKEHFKYIKKIEQINQYKQTLSCKKCGESRFYLLDFHHKDPNLKDYTISDNLRANFETIQQEIDKCDVLCANCHREWHYLSSHNIITDYNAWLGEQV